MKKNLLKKYSVFFAICVIICSSLWAAGQFKNIRAALNTSYQYVLNGKSILKDASVIRYKGQYYAPIADLGSALGYDAASTDTQTTLTTKKTDDSAHTHSTQTMNDAVITAIDFASKQVTVYPKGKSNSAENQLVLEITPTTSIVGSNSSSKLSITDLTTGMEVKVTYKTPTTKSIPPKATAVKIVVPTTPIQPR